MPDALEQRVLEALLDSWDRNNTIMLNLLRAVPEGGLEVKAAENSPSVGQQFMQIKLALKLAGRPIGDDEAGPLTWDVWRGRKG